MTTAKDLADRVSGSLVDAKSLADSLGTALALVALLAAFLIASLLTLFSVTKRIRELGTLKALGWSQRRVVGQVTGEALLQGVLGGLLGIGVGIGGAALIDVLAPSLEATFAGPASAAPRLMGPVRAGLGGEHRVNHGEPRRSRERRCARPRRRARTARRPRLRGRRRPACRASPPRRCPTPPGLKEMR